MDNGAHFWSTIRFDGIGIIPEIEAIDVFVVEPEAGVMRMVYTFAGARFEREAASDDGAFGGAERVKDRFFKSGGPDVGGEGLAVNGDVHSASLFVDSDGDAIWRMGTGGDERRQKHRHCNEQERYACGEDAHVQLWPPMTTKSSLALRMGRDKCHAGDDWLLRRR